MNERIGRLPHENDMGRITPRSGLPSSHVDAEPPPFQYAFTASSRTAPAMARAVVVHAHRRPSVGIFYLVVLLAMTCLLYTGLDDDHSVLARLIAATIYGAGATALVAAVVIGLIYVGNRRNLGRVAHDGAVLRTGFGEGEFVTATATSSSRFAYEGVEEVATDRDFVLIRLTGAPVVRVYPRALFPDDAVRRLELAVAERRRT